MAVGLALLAAGGAQGSGIRLLVQQIEAIGPRQWLGLMAGSIGATLPRRFTLPVQTAGLRGPSSVPQGEGGRPVA
jgi:hypothetical protein